MDSFTHLKIQNEIKVIQKEIQTIKEKIFTLYAKRRSSYGVRSLNNVIQPDEKNSKVNLECLFYNQFFKLKCKKDESLLTIWFPFNGENRFGLNLTQIGDNLWNLENCYLPCSVDIDYFRNKIKELPLEHIPEYIKQIQINVYAFYIRENHVQKLKEILNPQIRFYHCLRYKELELRFKVFNTETKTRKLLTLQIEYDFLTTEPEEITCKVNNTEDEECEEFFNSHFQIFKTCDLITAYNRAFKDVNKYTFFV